MPWPNRAPPADGPKNTISSLQVQKSGALVGPSHALAFVLRDPPNLGARHNFLLALSLFFFFRRRQKLHCQTLDPMNFQNLCAWWCNGNLLGDNDQSARAKMAESFLFLFSRGLPSKIETGQIALALLSPSIVVHHKKKTPEENLNMIIVKITIMAAAAAVDGSFIAVR